MIIIAVLITVCWLIFFIFWLITAFSTKKTIKKQSIKSRVFYKISVIIAYFFILEGINNKQLGYLNFSVIPSVTFTITLGLIITILGLVIAIWARVSLGTNWSGNITFKENHKLVKKGPYKFVRHPIYTGILLMSLGTVISIGTLASVIGLAILFISFWIKLKQEEKLMIEHFKKDYIYYKKATRALIPYLI